jgi:DNA invertase Pin-like site-specific DNA recombinase
VQIDLHRSFVYSHLLQATCTALRFFVSAIKNVVKGAAFRRIGRSSCARAPSSAHARCRQALQESLEFRTGPQAQPSAAAFLRCRGAVFSDRRIAATNVLQQSWKMRRKRSEPGDSSKAVAYIRVSTADQANGLEAQQSAIASWAAAKGVTVVAWAVDRGVSGSTSPADRDGLMDALGALSQHQAGLLVSANRSRFARDVAIAAAVERLAQESGARAITADGVDASATPEGALIRSVLDAFHAYELAVIRARTRAGLAAKRARGEALGNTPYGWGARERNGVKMLVENVTEQSALTVMQRMRDSGRTYAEIALALDEKQLPSRGKRWHASSVLRSLRSAERQRRATVSC